MTGTDPDRLRRRLRWAAEQLGLDPDASPAEVRAVWLERLPDEDFVPSSDQRWALEALLRRQPEGGWEARADEAAFVAEEERLRAEVETFAERFWDWPPHERRQHWEEFTDRCAAVPTVRARLNLLEAGLDVVPLPIESAEDARMVELAGHLCDLFILRPEPRARARQALLRRMADSKEEWQAAARRLRHTFPKVAALGTDLLDKVETVTVLPQRLPKRPPPRPVAASTESQSSRWVISLIVGMVLLVARACTSTSNRSPSWQTSPSSLSFPHKSPDPWQDLQGNPDAPKKWENIFEKPTITEEELKKFIEETKRKLESKKSGKERGATDRKPHE